MEHKLRTGDRIPSQRDLAAKLAVGVPAIREALKNLEAIGLLEIRHGKRTLVKRVDVDSLLESVSPAIQLTEAEVVHLLEFKEIIETRCAYKLMISNLQRRIIFIIIRLYKLRTIPS